VWHNLGFLAMTWAQLLFLSLQSPPTAGAVVVPTVVGAIVGAVVGLTWPEKLKKKSQKTFSHVRQWKHNWDSRKGMASQLDNDILPFSGHAL